MNLKDILAISGESTLFKFVAQGKNAVIVENLETGRRFSAGAAAKVSALDEIAIFTTDEDIPLAKVMDLIFEKENGGEAISHKQPDAGLKTYFAEVLPEYDRERVYTSDIKKVLLWYNILHKLNLLVKEEEKPEDGTGEPLPAVDSKQDASDNETGKTDAAKKTGKAEATKNSGAAPKPPKPAVPKGGKVKPKAGK